MANTKKDSPYELLRTKEIIAIWMVILNTGNINSMMELNFKS